MTRGLCLLMAVLQLWLVRGAWARLSDHEGGEGFYTEPAICTISPDDGALVLYHGGNIESLAMWAHAHAQDSVDGYTFVSQDWAAISDTQPDCPVPRGSIFAVDQDTFVIQLSGQPLVCENCDTGTHMDADIFHPDPNPPPEVAERNFNVAFGAVVGAIMGGIEGALGVRDVVGYLATLATPEAREMSRNILAQQISRGTLIGMAIGVGIGLSVTAAKALEREIILITGHLLTDRELQELGLGPDPADPAGNIPYDDATCCTTDPGSVDPADPGGNQPAEDCCN